MPDFSGISWLLAVYYRLVVLNSFLASGIATIIARTTRAGAIAVFAVSVMVVVTVSHWEEVIRGSAASAKKVAKFVNIVLSPFTIYLLYKRI